MAEVDGRVLGLLEPLQEGGAAGLANAALTRIDAAEEARADEDGDADADADADVRDPFAPVPGEGESARALRQLEIADAVVGGRLELEAALDDGIAEELALLREASRSGSSADGPGFAVDTVVIAPTPDDGRGEDGRSGDEDGTADGGGAAFLGRGDRAEAARSLLKAWRRGVESVREAIGG